MVSEMWEGIAALCKKHDGSFNFSGKACRQRWMKWHENDPRLTPPVEKRTWLDSTAKNIIREREEEKALIREWASRNPSPRVLNEGKKGKGTKSLSDEAVEEILAELKWLAERPRRDACADR